MVSPVASDTAPDTRAAASSSTCAPFCYRLCRPACLLGISQRVARFAQWRVAARCLALIIRNVSISSTVMWIAAFVCSRGSPFHVQPVHKQLRVVFVAATMVWLQSVVMVLQTVNHSMRVVPHCFVTHPPIDRPPGFLYCVGRLARATSPHTALALGLTLGTAILGDCLPHKWKIEFYLTCAISLYHFSACDIIARRICSEETVSGQAKQRERDHASRALIHSRVGRQRTSSLRRIARSFVQNFPILLSVYVTGGYIHVINGLAISSSNTIHVTVFYIVSLALKLATQEIAKYFIIKSKTASTRDMCAIICTPTVVIETQVRVVIVSLQRTTSNTVKNTLLMAAVEVLLRLGKAMWIRWTITIREKRLALRDHRQPPRPRLPWPRVGRRAVAIAAAPQASDLVSDSQVVQANEKRERDAFEKWRALMFTIHTAETFVDMYAEYIAIGCATAIAYLFAGHSHFIVSGSNASAPPSESSSTTHPVAALLFQVVVEMIADYVACLLEISQGVDVQGMEAVGTFFGFLFTFAAVVNVYITAVLYLK